MTSPRPRRLPHWLPPAVRVALGVLALTLTGWAAGKAAVDAGRPRLADACMKAATVAAATVAIAAPAPVGNTATVVSQRLVGGVVGGGIAAGLSSLTAVAAPALVGTLQAVVGVVLAGVLVYVGQDSALQYMATFGVACYLVVTATAGGAGAAPASILAAARGVGALVGALASGVLATVVLPQTASRDALDSVQAALDGVASLAADAAAASPPPPTDARAPPLLAPAAADGVRAVLAALDGLDTALEWVPTETPLLRRWGGGRALCYAPAPPRARGGAARAAALERALAPLAAAVRASAHTFWLASAAAARPRRTDAAEAAVRPFMGGHRLADVASPAAAAWSALADAWATRAPPPPDVGDAVAAAADAVCARAAAAMAARRGVFAATGAWAWSEGLPRADQDDVRVAAAAETTLARRVAEDVGAAAEAVRVAVEVVRRVG